MKLAALSSGGKDSLYAMYLAKKAGHSISYILSMIPKSEESYMFHHPNVCLSEVQAGAMKVPVLFGETAGRKEEEVADLEELVSMVSGEVEGVVTGAIASNYQRERVEKVCGKLGLKCVSPLWGADVEKYWDDLLSAGFKVLVSRVAAEGLGRGWLGRVMDSAAVAELRDARKKYKFHLAFEGGEAETFVLDCPMFSKKVVVVEAETTWDGQSGNYYIKNVKLIDKL